MMPRFVWVFALGAFLTGQAVCQNPRQPMDEYQVKAAVVLNFARFVQWPDDATGSADPFAICVMGRNPFGRTLEGMTDGKSIDGRAFVVRQVADAHQAAACRILFVSSSERLRYRSILQSLHGSSVFSVGDTNDFVSEGGIAGLRLENGKVRIELNAEAARENNLRISSRLMSLAENVK